MYNKTFKNRQAKSFNWSNAFWLL